MENEKVPHEAPNSFKPLTPRILAIASLATAIFLIAIFFRKKKSASKRTSFLLVGPSDAGKTSIMTQLVYEQTLPTQTSMQTNSAFASLSSKRIQVIDVPGHPRLRNHFEDHFTGAKVIGFVVDANTISRNGASAAEHLHYILHAITTVSPSETQPALIILAHKTDLFKSISTSDSSVMAKNRVKTILERELEKRRASQSGGVHVEGLGEEGEGSDMGGLDCGEKEGSTFKFDDWGDVTFLGTSIISDSADEKGSPPGLNSLRELLDEYM